MREGAALRFLFLALAGAACLAAGSGDVLGLTDEEIFRTLPFNYIPAGARAAAMGGASVATANDASAVLTNPAGLRSLQEGQFFIEYRSLNPEDPNSFESNVGSLAVDPVTGDRDLPYLSLSSGSRLDSQGMISLVSFVWPFTLGDGNRRLQVGGSRQVIVSSDQTLPSSGDGTKAVFSFDSFPNTVVGGEVVAYSVSAPVTGSSSMEIIYWNGTVSYDVHPDFSVGLTVTQATLDLRADTTTRAEDPLQLYLDPSHPRLPGQPTTDIYDTHIDGTDSDIAYTLGFHWHPGSSFATGASPWEFGAVFQKGARFSVRESTVLNQQPDRSFENRVSVPDRYAVGALYRLETSWLFTLELERVEFSDLDGGFESGINFLTSPTVTGSFGIDPAASVKFEASDGTVVRAGAEYFMPLWGKHEKNLVLRGGYFRSPDDQIRMTEFNSQDAGVNSMYRKAFPGGEAMDHFTLGAGVTIGRHQFQIAGETSDQGSQLLLSYVLNLGKNH